MTQAHPWSDFFRAAREQAPPPTMLLLLRALPELRPPHYAVFSWMFSFATVALLLFRIDAPGWLRRLVPFTIIILLEYGVIARYYVPGLFFLVLAAYFHQRHRPAGVWWCLAASASMHVFFLFVTPLLLAFDLWNRRREMPAIPARWWHLSGIALLLGLSALSLKAPPGSVVPAHFDWTRLDWTSIMSVISFGLTGLDGLSGPYRWNVNAWNDLPLWPVAVALAAMGFQGYPVFRFLASISVLSVVLITTGYPLNFRYAAVMFCAALYLALISERFLRKRFPVFAVFVFIMVFVSGRWLATWKPWQSPPAANFSGASELAASQRDALKNAVLVIDGSAEWGGYGIAGRIYPKPETYSLHHQEVRSFEKFTWDTNHVNLDAWCAANIGKLDQMFGGQPVLVVTKRGIPATCGPAKLLFRNSMPVFTDEVFALFELYPGRS